MTVSLADVELSTKLRSATEPVDVVDEDGVVVGSFSPMGFAPPGWAKAHSPNSREELERRRQEARANPGRPLADILRDLHAQYGEGPK